ncbi:MAG: PKD domain-containing protein [Desulfobacterales bacterium]
MLYYLLTGDRKAWEAAEENGKAALNHYGTGGLFDADVKRPAQYETRMETWPILNLVNLYRVSGNAEYLRVAKNIAKNRLLVREQAAGGKGYFGSGDENSVSDASQSTVMWMYAIEAMISIHYETQDPDLRQLLIRMADFTKDSFLFGGAYNAKGEYMPVLSTWIWHKNDPDGSAGLAALDPNASDFYTKKEYYSAEPVNTFFWADLFAYAYRLTDKTEYMDWARKCFRDSIFYYDKEGKTYGTDGYINPDSRARLSFIDGKYPESRTKIHGWIARTNQIYLFTEWQLQQGGLRIFSSSLPDGTEGSAYSHALSVSGGTAPYTCTVISGSLPEGLTLNPSDAVISGTPGETGTFSFAVRVQDAASASAAASLTITVKSAAGADEEPPVADFTADKTSGTAPLTVRFTDKSLHSPTSWAWDFDNDGTIDANLKNPEHTYTAAGTYAVALAVTSQYGSDQKTVGDYIHVAAGGGTVPDPTLSEHISVIRKDCTGYANCYTSLSAWEADFGGIDFGSLGCAQGDLVCANKIAVAECHNDWPQGLNDSPVIEGWKTDAEHYIRIYTPKSERHKGKILENGTYTGFGINLSAGDMYVKADYTVIDGIVFHLLDNGRQIILGQWNGGGRYCVFRNNITYNGRYRHLGLGDYQAATVYNNFMINDTGRQSGYGIIDCGPSNAQYFHRIYSNSFYSAGDFGAVDGNSANARLEIAGNVCLKAAGSVPCFAKFDAAYFRNNISSDSSASGSSSQTGKSLNDIRFVSVAKGSADLHLQPGSAALDSGADLSSVFKEDVDGQNRTGLWDAGADELSEAQTGEPPVADFTSDKTAGEAPLTVKFADKSLNSPTSWAWDFDNDGTVDSDRQHPEHTYSAKGTYTVSLTVGNPYGNDKKTLTGHITVSEPGLPATPPVADFTSDKTGGKAPLTVKFADKSLNSPISWAWDFDNDGTVDSDRQHPEHTYSAKGTYTVSLTVGNGNGNDKKIRENYITVTDEESPEPLPSEHVSLIRKNCSGYENCYESLSAWQADGRH